MCHCQACVERIDKNIFWPDGLRKPLGRENIGRVRRLCHPRVTYMNARSLVGRASQLLARLSDATISLLSILVTRPVFIGTKG